MFADNIFEPNRQPLEISEEQAKAGRIDRFGYDPEDPQSAIEGPMPKPKPLPGAGYEPGLFEGSWEAPLKGVAAGIVRTAGSATGLIGDVFNAEGFREFSRDMRMLNRKYLDPDPEEMGEVAQIIFGFSEFASKAAGYALTMGPIAGSVAFGADTGLGEYYKLKDEGVKPVTAAKAGAATAAANTLGVLVPAATGTSRAVSAAYGAGANVALDLGERAAVRAILEADNYQKIANRYETSWGDVALSAGLGAFFGTVAWRSPLQIRRERINRRADAIAANVAKQLEATNLFTREEAITQARLNARGSAALLENAGKSDDEIAKIVFDDMTKRGESDELGMGITQDRPWGMGSHVIGKETTEVNIVRVDPVQMDRKGAIEALGKELADGLENKQTGWILKGSRSDAKKSLPPFKFYAEAQGLYQALVAKLSDIASAAVIVESHVDVQHRSQNVRGVHKFVTPVTYNGRDYRVQMIVRDYTPAAGGERLATHSIDAIEVHAAGYSEGGGVIAPRAPAATTSVLPGATESVGAPVSKQWSSENTTILSDLLNGFVREDGKSAFDPIDETSRTDESGPYYEPPEVIAATDRLARESGDYGLMTREPSSDELNQRVVKIKKEDDFDPNWRPLRRTADNMTQEEMAVFNEYVDSRPDAARIRANFERLEGTPWAMQAREAVFVRASILDLMAGREPRVQSMVDHPQMRKLKRLLQQRGEEGLWDRLGGSKFVGDAAKPANNVNGSFLDCSPSADCARFCYATEGNYRYAATVVKSELIAEAVRRDPVRAAEMTARDYKATSEFANGKALRLYDKGDGGEAWVPYINELNKLGVRVQIFSKRADFLRQVSDFNLRLLSIDASNLKMADENPDLKVAFVYSDPSQVPTILDLHRQGRISVILPVKEGRSYMSADKVAALKNADKTLAKHICPIDAGWKKIKTDKQPDGWNCTMCDKNAGVGCFHGASTTDVMRAASRSEAELVDIEGMDIVSLAKLLQKELGNDLERVAGNRAASGGTESQLGSVQGSSRSSGTIHVSGAVANHLQALLSRLVRGGERDSGARSEGRIAGVRETSELGRAGVEEADGELYQRSVAGDQRSGGEGSAADAELTTEQKAAGKQLVDGEVRGSFSYKLNRIILTAMANLSTFAHEHSHWYMSKLLAYAGEEGMSKEVVEDAKRLLNALGIKSLDEWNAMSFEEQRKYHERFAAWTEIYLARGEVPVPGLRGVFKRFGEWLCDMYRKQFDQTAEENVGERYKAEFDEDLPPLSDEVKDVLARMYGADKKFRSIIPSRVQTVAARIAQANRANTDRVVSPMKDSQSDAAYHAARAAQSQASEQIAEGEKVDVSTAVDESDVNTRVVDAQTKSFARTAQMGGSNETIVVLQNRDRSTVASQAQMNSIAADPQYGKLSFSRTTDSGAPIVSYGSLPAQEFVGNTDYVTDRGQRVPVTYAVVEADSIMTSNSWDGRPNEAYGTDPEQMQAVAGNGRVAGLQEAYNRGTTDAYVQEMQADTTHGVSPEAIGKLQKPVLVRYVGRENVTTGFVDRSNQSAVLDLSGKERAVKDAGKLTSARMRGYTFDEDGNPTRDTLERFVNDIGEPSSLGALIDDNGLPTDRARDRIRAAVFYAAYRDEDLTALVVDSSDKQGIKRILNAMSAFAPNVIAIREASNGAIDLGPVIVEAVNRIRSGRLVGEGDMFEETNPAVDQVFNILSQNRNSAAAIGRVFNDFMDRIESALGGGTDALFGEAPDLAIAMQYLRAAENAQGERLLELGKEFAPLPDIDVESVRATLAALQEAAPNAEKVAVAMGEKVLEDAGVVTKAEPEVEAPSIDPRDPARAGLVFTESADVERLRNLFAEDPEAAYVIEGPDGVAREMTAQDILDMERQYAEQGQTDAVGIGKATECILRNGGIKE